MLHSPGSVRKLPLPNASLSSLSSQLLLRAGEPLGRNVRGGRDWDETFRLAYQTFFGSSPCSNRLPAAPRMGINGSAHPELTCHQILASFFQVHVGDRRESGRSQVCAPAPITHCHTDPDPAEPSSTQEITRVSPPQELKESETQNNQGHLAPGKTSAQTGSSPSATPKELGLKG